MDWSERLTNFYPNPLQYTWIEMDTSVAKQALSAVVTLTLRATPITWVLKCLREVRVYLKSGIIDSLKLTHMHFPQL